VRVLWSPWKPVQTFITRSDQAASEAYSKEYGRPPSLPAQFDLLDTPPSPACLDVYTGTGSDRVHGTIHVDGHVLRNGHNHPHTPSGPEQGPS
jgi:hypothetical protein